MDIQERVKKNLYAKQWRHNNKERVKENRLRWNARNLEKHKAIRAEWSKNNPEKRRASHIKYKYKITQADYDAMLAEQNGACAMCPATEPGRKRNHFCIDHDHETGKIRGLLCYDCNTGIGFLKHSPELLQAAINYLQSNNHP